MTLQNFLQKFEQNFENWQFFAEQTTQSLIIEHCVPCSARNLQSKSFLMSQKLEMQVCQWYGVKRLNPYQNKR